MLHGVASSYSAAAQRWTAGRVAEWFSGSECASWLYYAPVGGDAHLAAWFEVRLWNGGAIEILPWLENGAVQGQRVRIRPGEELTITENDQPLAKVVLVAAEKHRPIPGRASGMLEILVEDDEHLKDFEEYMS